MSAIVPWTDPGGTPCCCGEDCFTDFANEPKPTYAQNSFSAITSADYAALYAGGTYTASVEMDILGFRDSTTGLSVFRDTEQHLLSISDVALTQTQTQDGPCYERYSATVTITREFETRTGAGTNTYTSPLVFVRSLGTSNGQRRLSLASVYNPSSTTTSPFNGQPITEILALDNWQSQFPSSIVFYAGNMTNTVPYFCAGGATFAPNLPNVTSSMSLSLVGGGTYAAVGVVAHPCFSTTSHYNQVINGAVITNSGFQLYGDVSGSISIEVTFTPSAP